MLDRAPELVHEALAGVVHEDALRIAVARRGRTAVEPGLAAVHRRRVLLDAGARPNGHLDAGAVAHAHACAGILRLLVVHDVGEQVVLHHRVAAEAAGGDDDRLDLRAVVLLRLVVDVDDAGDRARLILHEALRVAVPPVLGALAHAVRAVDLGHAALLRAQRRLVELVRADLLENVVALALVLKVELHVPPGGVAALLEVAGDVPVERVAAVLGELHDQARVGIVLAVEHPVVVELDRIDLRRTIVLLHILGVHAALVAAQQVEALLLLGLHDEHLVAQLGQLEDSRRAGIAVAQHRHVILARIGDQALVDVLRLVAPDGVVGHKALDGAAGLHDAVVDAVLDGLGAQRRAGDDVHVHARALLLDNLRAEGLHSILKLREEVLIARLGHLVGDVDDLALGEGHRHQHGGKAGGLLALVGAGVVQDRRAAHHRRRAACRHPFGAALRHALGQRRAAHQAQAQRAQRRALEKVSAGNILAHVRSSFCFCGGSPAALWPHDK